MEKPVQQPAATPAPTPIASPIEEDIAELNIASYGVSLTAGAIATDTSVRYNIYKNLRNQGLFKDLEKERAAKMNKLLETPSTNTPDILKKIQYDYRDIVRDRFEKLGFHGFQDYWKGITRHQKLDALITGATLSGIVLSALYVFEQTQKQATSHVDNLRRKREGAQEHAQESPESAR